MVFEAQNLTDISKAWRRLYNELVPMSMYTLADLPAIECFYPVFPSKYQTIPSLWKQCFSDGTFDTLINMKEYCPPETPYGYEGYMRDFCEEDGTFTYLAGFFM